MLETELSQPACEWLVSIGFEAYTEVPGMGTWTDIVGLHEATDVMLSIELKTSLTRQVIIQASRNQPCYHLSYVCVGTRPRALSVHRCRRYGIGVLGVYDGKAVVLQDAIMKRKPWMPQLISSLSYLLNMEPGGVAGNPNLKGVGPAQTCYGLVTEFRAKHPKATWRQIYEAVPNHYCSHNSMSGAMKTVEFERWRKSQRIRILPPRKSKPSGL